MMNKNGEQNVNAVTPLPPAPARRDPGRIVIRVIAVMMLTLALWQAGSFLIGVFRAGGLDLNPNSPYYALLYWRIIALALWCLLVFAGVQLFRLRRSGWIASLLFFAASTAWLVYLIESNYIENQIGATVGRIYPDEVMQSLALPHVTPQIERMLHVLRFYLACHFIPLVYLASEWRRFVGERRPSAALTYVKLGLAVASIAAAGVWDLWAASYLERQSVLEALRSPAPNVTAQDFARLNEREKAQACALLIRRLAKEQTGAVAREVHDLRCSTGLQFLAVEDVPALIAATHNKDAAVANACYEVLGEIKTPEAEACLRERLDGPRDDVWNTALYSLAGMRPDKAPDVLIELASKPGPERKDLLDDLAKFRDPRALQILLAAARDPDAAIRREALMRLDNFPGQTAEQALQAGTEDSDGDCKFWAFTGLSQIGTAASVPWLIRVLKQPDADVPYSGGSERLHEDAAGTLSAITGQDFGEDEAKWEQWWQENAKTFDMRRKYVDRLFAPLPPPPRRLPRSVAEAQADPYINAWGRRTAALRAIWRRDMRDLAPDVARSLAESDNTFAAYVLTQWGYREGIDWYLTYMEKMTPLQTPSSWCGELARATGVNFFGDVKRWREWWEANKQKFPSALDGEERATTDRHR